MKLKNSVAFIALILFACTAVYLLASDGPEESMLLPKNVTEQDIARAIDPDSAFNIRVLGCRQGAGGLYVLYNYSVDKKSFISLVHMDESLCVDDVLYSDKYAEYDYSRVVSLGGGQLALFGRCNKPADGVVLRSSASSKTINAEKGFYFAFFPSDEGMLTLTNGDMYTQVANQASYEACINQFLVRQLAEKHGVDIHLAGLEITQLDSWSYPDMTASGILGHSRISFKPEALQQGYMECLSLERAPGNYQALAEVNGDFGTTIAAVRHVAQECGLKLEALDGNINFPLQNNMRYVLPEFAAQDEAVAAHLLIEAFLTDLSDESLYKKVPARSFVITAFQLEGIDASSLGENNSDLWLIVPDVEYSYVGYLHGQEEISGLHLAKRNGYYILTSPLALPDTQHEHGGLYLASFAFAGAAPGDYGLSACIEGFLQAIIDENIKLQASDKDKSGIVYTLDSFTFSLEEQTAIIHAAIRATYPNVPGGEIRQDVENGNFNIPNDWLSGLGFGGKIEGVEMVSTLGISMQYDTAQALWRCSEYFPK